MASTDQLTRSARALHALLAAEPTDTPAVVAGKSVDPDAFHCPAAAVVADRQIPAALRSADPPAVVAVGTISATLGRALRSHPPELVVITGDLPADTAEALTAIPGLHLLGPRAHLHVGEGQVLALATSGEELGGLQRVLARAGGTRLAVAPAPGWIARWLADEEVASSPIAGYVLARDLDLQWARWARGAAADQIVVPLGTASWNGNDEDPALEATVAAHALERLTGPVFPAPRVLARLLGDPGESSGEPTEEQLALWEQARRALPILGAAVGMETPRPDLSMAVPTAAFLAQRVRLRIDQRLALIRKPGDDLEPLDDGAMERAQQVLASSSQVLSDHESKVVLRGAGMSVTRQAVASSATGAAHYAETIGFPVVLKALSPDLRRKQEIGGVVLDLGTAAAVRRAYADIGRNVEERAPTARLDGVLVSEMVGPGLDVRCGMTRLPTGEAVLHGRALAGPGTLEPALALAPLEPADAMLLAHAVLSRIPYPALRRDTDPDVLVLANLFRCLDRLLRVTGDRILSIDLSPARWVHDARGYVVLDARIVQRAHLDGL